MLIYNKANYLHGHHHGQQGSIQATSANGHGSAGRVVLVDQSNINNNQLTTSVAAPHFRYVQTSNPILSLDRQGAATGTIIQPHPVQLLKIQEPIATLGE